MRKSFNNKRTIMHVYVYISHVCMYVHIYINIYFTHIFHLCASNIDYVDLRPLEYYDTSSGQ
jgi:hypothetical protein